MGDKGEGFQNGNTFKCRPVASWRQGWCAAQGYRNWATLAHPSAHADHVQKYTARPPVENYPGTHLMMMMQPPGGDPFCRALGMQSKNFPTFARFGHAEGVS